VANFNRVVGVEDEEAEAVAVVDTTIAWDGVGPTLWDQDQIIWDEVLLLLQITWVGPTWGLMWDQDQGEECHHLLLHGEVEVEEEVETVEVGGISVR
jgi:hypothetical protein